MRKKNKAFLFLNFLLGIMLIPKSALGFSCSNTLLVTDKNSYNNNEIIYLNGSWELYYNSGFEISYIQIQITNIFDNILWNSSNYYAIGISQKNWTINIQFLNLTLTNNSCKIYIKMFNYYENFNSHDVVATYKEIITVNVTKREVDCELTNFKSDLIYGESNLFNATFYSGNTSYCLVNETLQSLIRNNDEIIYQTNFTTDNDGMVSFNISTVNHLSLGRNNISFIIKNNPYYLDTTFSYEIYVNKIPVYGKITNFVNSTEEGSVIKIQLFYYYFNSSIKPLENENLKIIVYSNSTLEYEEMLKTNQTGFVDINILPSIFNFEEGDKMFYVDVDVIFNGTIYLENKTMSLSFQILNFLKRDVDCELTNFKSDLIYGESNLFNATFYSGNTSYCLINETLQCLIRNNDETIYLTNFTTDNDGMISFNISTLKHLDLGRNDVSFNIRNNSRYLDTTFSYEIYVNKIPVYVEITNFVNSTEEGSLVKIQLFYYYFNSSIKPLENENLKIIVYSNSTLEYEEMLKTNQTGFVNINILPSTFNFEEGDKMFYVDVDVIFNGTIYLENKTMSLSFQILNFLKRDVNCELTNFKSDLIYGESNLFNATFYSGNTSYYLVNETLLCLIRNNDQIIYQTNFTTDNDGMVSFNISTVKHLGLGRNNVSFIIKNNSRYLDTPFSYEIYVKKIPVYGEITNFVNSTEEGSVIKIQLFYYYFHTSEKPLENENLKIIVYSNSTLEYEEMLKTNQTGFVNIIILPSTFNFKEGDKIFYIDVIFNGTIYLENKTISLSFQIHNTQYYRNYSSFYFVNICLLSILAFLFTSIGLKVYKYKKAGFKLIRDITFKF